MIKSASAPVRGGQTGAEARLSSDGQRSIQPLPRRQDGFVGVRLQVRVALSGLEALVTQKVLDLVEGHPFLHQPRGTGVPHGVRRIVRDGPLVAV